MQTITRSDIADFSGLTIATVNRTSTKFRSAHLIDLEQNSLVTIQDVDAFNQLAEGSGTTHG